MSPTEWQKNWIYCCSNTISYLTTSCVNCTEMFCSHGRSLFVTLYLIGSFLTINSFSVKNCISQLKGLYNCQTQLRVAPSGGNDDQEYEYARINQRSKRERFTPDADESRTKNNDIFDPDDPDDDEDDDDFDDVIPNALLDQIDPDGVVDRIPELLSDPKFWLDAFIVFLLASYAALDPSSPLRFISADDIDYTQFYPNN